MSGAPDRDGRGGPRDSARRGASLATLAPPERVSAATLKGEAPTKPKFRYGMVIDTRRCVGCRVRVRVTRRMHPEVVGLQHSFGHTALGRLAKGRGTTDSPLRPTEADPLSGQALHQGSVRQNRQSLRAPKASGWDPGIRVPAE